MRMKMEKTNDAVLFMGMNLRLETDSRFKIQKQDNICHREPSTV